MNEQPNELETRLQSLTTWPDAEQDPTLWAAALERADEPRGLRLPSRSVLGVAAAVMLAAVGVWAAMGTLGERSTEPPTLSYARELPAQMASDPAESRVYGGTVGDATLEPQASLDFEPRAIQRSATMELTTGAVRPLFDRLTALTDPGLGEFIENASATGERAEATLRVSAQRLDAVMRSIREMEGVAEVRREELSAVDATDRRADLAAWLANERRIEAELLALLDKRPDAPLSDVLKVRDALRQVRLNIERFEGQRATLAERVALATLRVVVVAVREEAEPEPAASGFPHDLREAFGRGGRTLAGSAAWLVEVLVGGLLVWLLLAVAGAWLVRTLRWRASWA